MSSIINIENFIERDSIVNAEGETLFECWQNFIRTSGCSYFGCFVCKESKKERANRSLDNIGVQEIEDVKRNNLEYYCIYCKRLILTVDKMDKYTIK